MDSSPSTPDHTNIKTVIDLFFWRVGISGDAKAVSFYHGENRVTVRWETLGEEVQRTAAMLVQRGVQPGDSVVQVSENRYEWLVFDLAIQFCGAIHVPVHATLSAAQIAFQIVDSGAQLVVLASPDQYEDLLSLMVDFPQLGGWIFFDSLPHSSPNENVYLHRELVSSLSSPEMAQVGTRRQPMSGEDVATILYTSGTTGEPKGVMLTHRNLLTNTLSILAANQQEPEDLRLSLLPWSHIFARTCDIYCWIASGCQLAIAESRDKILDNCQEWKPTLLNAVPYFYDKLYRILSEQGAHKRTGSLKEILGGEIRVCGSGGAALPSYIEEFFQRQQIVLLPGYGLTETSPVISISTLNANRPGTVGRPLRDIEIRISDEGEILTRGPHVMKGYYKNRVATDEIIREGWLHTGDLGTLSDDGYLTITGRKKEIIVLSTGKNVSPANLELKMMTAPLILRGFVLGDDQSFLAALIVPDPEVLRGEIFRRGISVSSPREALSHPEVLEMYQKTLAQCLAELAPYEQIRKFRLLDRDFSMEKGELTPTLKLRRRVILKNFGKIIDAMYAE